jgi:hypothetical protein
LQSDGIFAEAFAVSEARNMGYQTLFATMFARRRAPTGDIRVHVLAEGLASQRLNAPETSFVRHAANVAFAGLA